MAGEHAPDRDDAKELRLEGLAVPEGIDALHELVEQARARFPEVAAETWMLMETAVVEVAGNVVEHGRPTGKIRWSLTLRVRADQLEAVLADDGQTYTGDLTAVMPETSAEAGRGFALANAVLDEFDYERRDGVNVWTMRRARA